MIRRRIGWNRFTVRRIPFHEKQLPVRACIEPSVEFNQASMNLPANISLLAVMVFLAGGCTTTLPTMNSNFQNYTLDYNTPVTPPLQADLEKIDADLRAKHGMTAEQADVGLLDLQTLRLAMLRPDHEEYAASVAKIGILLAYIQLHPAAATNLDATTRHELGLMVRPSSDEMATKFAKQMGLRV